MCGRLILLLIPLILISCVHKYAVPEQIQSQSHLPAASAVYVATPADGADDRPRTYKGSGGWTSEAIATALRERAMHVTRGTVHPKAADAVAAAAAAGASFLVYTEIAHWSDRVTEWSGIPDRITLNVSTYEVASGTLLSRQEIKASSRWATLGGDHPLDLLPGLARRWAESVVKQLD